MYRSKSSVSLRALAYSIKQSIVLDRQKSQIRLFKPLKSSLSISNLHQNNLPLKKKSSEEYLIMMGNRKSMSGQRINRLNQKTPNTSERPFNANTIRKQILQTHLQHQSNIQFPRIRFASAEAHQQCLTSIPLNQATQNLFILNEELNRLNKQFTKNQFDTNLKLSNKYLEESEKLTAELKEISSKEKQFIQHRNQLKNRLLFLFEEIRSQQMNFAEDLAEKQYCEDLLVQYQNDRQFGDEAKKVVQMIQVEYNTKNLIQPSLTELTKNLETLEKSYEQWKQEENIELNKKRFENKLKQLRINLIKIEQQLDSMAQQILPKSSSPPECTFRKVREFICAYFKKYNQLNINHISHNQIADGIDIFLCKEGLIQDLANFVNQKTSKITFSSRTYSVKLKEYLDCLKQIQNLFNKQKTEINHVVAFKFQEKIISTKDQIRSLSSAQEKNLRNLQNMQQNIEKAFTHESLSIIEVLSKNQFSEFGVNKKEGFFNINMIKSKVKNKRIEHNQRIARIKEIYTRFRRIQIREQKYIQTINKKNQQIRKSKQEIYQQIKLCQQNIQQILSIKQGYQIKKVRFDELIQQTINQMKQKESLSIQIKTIQTQISNIKKIKIQALTQNFEQQKYINMLEKSHQNQYSKYFQTISTLPKIVSNNFLRQKSKLELNSLQTHKKKQSQSPLYENAQPEKRTLSNTKSIYKNPSKISLKFSNKDKDSSQNITQRMTPQVFSNILQQKCNGVPIQTNETNSLKNKNIFFKSEQIIKRQNQQRDQKLLLFSKSSTMRPQASVKQSHLRKTSDLKLNRRQPIKYTLSQNNQSKLFLLSNKHQSVKNNPSQSKSNLKKSTNKLQKNFKQKTLDTLIFNKLLR